MPEVGREFLNSNSRLVRSEKNNSDIGLETHSSGEKFRNSEWRRRDFDDGNFKNMLTEFKTTVQEHHLKELNDAHARIIEKDNQVESLKNDLRQQSDLMVKLQEEINSLMNDQKTHRHDQAKYLKKQLKEMNSNFSGQIDTLQVNIEKTTENLKELISQQKKATEDFNKLQKNQKEQMKKLIKERNNQQSQQLNTNNGGHETSGFGGANDRHHNSSGLNNQQINNAFNSNSRKTESNFERGAGQQDPSNTQAPHHRDADEENVQKSSNCYIF